jgi:MarR family transcriptional regulator, organic hydroperoxide resistance regulator
MDYVSAHGPAAFGSRLRRLVERLDREVSDIYRAAGIDFEPRWYGVVRALHEGGPQSVGGLASQLGVTHAAVSQVRAALERAGLIIAEPDPLDGRRQRLMLSPAGFEAVEKMQNLWAAIGAATLDLLQQGAPGLLSELSGLEAAMSERGLKSRVDAKLAQETA